MNLIKRIGALFFILLLLFSLGGCSKNDNRKNLITLGINIETPKNMKFGYSESKVFKYNKTTIPSITVQGVSKKESILFKSFPFTVEDYKKHFKSAFSNKNIIDLKYDYKEIKPKKKSNIEKIYKSKAKVMSDGKEKYSYVYLLSFKGKSGTLIIETTSKRDKDFEDIVLGIKNISTNVENIKYSPKKSNEKMKKVTLIDNITVDMPSSYEIRENKTKDAYYINGFGNNEAMYTILSKKKISSTDNFFWNNVNGYEVLKKFNKDNYLIHDLNTQSLYNLNTINKEVKDKKGQKYYLRIEKITPIKK